MKRILIIILIFVPTLLNAQRIKEIVSAEAKPILSRLNSRSSVIIDGRTVAMYNSGHIRGAVCIDADSGNAVEELSKYLRKKTIVVYCTTNRRTTKIIGMLKDLGYKGRLVVLTDGITGWKANGMEVVVTEK